MLGYILTAIISATITMVVMACFKVGKDPLEEIQQIHPPRHEMNLVSAETGAVRNVWCECFVNDEELNNPEPYVRELVQYRLMEKLSEQIWPFVSISRFDDRLHFRAGFLANIKIIDTGTRNPIVTEDALWKS